MSLFEWTAKKRAEWKALREKALKEEKTEILTFKASDGSQYYAPTCISTAACAKIETEWERTHPRIELPKDYK